MSSFHLTQGDTPVLVSMPHAGTHLTPQVEVGLSHRGLSLIDTDWHIPRLYDFLDAQGVGRLQAKYSRYVVDLNRSADDKPLYAGATTGLFPEVDFDGEPLYRAGHAPSKDARDWALDNVWRPYHLALSEELARLRRRFGYAVLFDAHSIRSQVARLFDGQLPDINLGTNDGGSCDATLSDRLESVCAAQSSYSWVVNGRFKGGFITRHYGTPNKDVHAVQLELSQVTYMEEPREGALVDASTTFPYREREAKQVQALLIALVEELLVWRPRREPETIG
ncbi:N-formylglutamate deformylase [Salinicola sp. CPA57]|uniref:N-formylglutamate deformylase n=1 Tax=Salinicola sp. CPA57 TaxID=1949080 RepID=UPI000DA1FE0A|nr:N-formylglutamate deformylase [Salinicola sp. CPA57]